jgi:hypothetical protein
MLPLPAAFLAVKAADIFVRGLQSLRSSKEQAAQSNLPQPQAQARPDVSHAPRFAEVFNQQRSALNADPMARAIAGRLVQITHRPMRTEEMEQFVLAARQAYLALANGEPAQSPTLAQFAQLLRGKLEMTQPQVEHVMSQLTEIARANEDVQNRFLMTGGEALSLPA